MTSTTVPPRQTPHRVAQRPGGYRISRNPLLGSVRIAVPSDPAAERAVSARTVAGAIEVTPR